MIKKEVTYENLFTGEKMTDVLYFNLTEIEFVKFCLKYGQEPDSINRYIQKIQKDNNNKASFDFMEDILLSSYGVKSSDGNGFIKPKDKIEEFKCSSAYSNIFTELLGDEEKLNNFITGIMSGIDKNKLEEARKIVASSQN